ncbi:hypothetical protein [Bacillus pumilus]|uniref:hypothetical protein n=1 Tax=Bacillus pumilus TaxID=1408 RepID=UPI001C2169EF|nr:hypothetical protein [Bacillus pumilus]MBU8573745.1 hypothetical protein [Bacillus pumilus]
MDTYKYGELVEVVSLPKYRTAFDENLKVGMIGRVINHEKEDDDFSYVEIDFYYKENDERLANDEYLMRDEIVDGRSVHEEHLKRVAS